MTQAKREIVEVSGNPLHEYIAQATASGHLYRELGREFTWDALVRLLQKDGYGPHSKNQKEVGQGLKAAGVAQIRPTREGRKLRLYLVPEEACEEDGEPEF